MQVDPNCTHSNKLGGLWTYLNVYQVFLTCDHPRIYCGSGYVGSNLLAIGSDFSTPI